jgi:hypothetical protein
MPNSNAPTGLSPKRLRNGAPWVGPLRRYFHPATDATALYIGDPVIIAGSADADGTPTCTRATAASAGRITGVVVGFEPNATLNASGFGAASTAFYPLVCDDPNVLYEIQEDSVGGALAATSVGLNADLIAAAGNNATKQSGFMLDSSTAAVTATLQLRVVALEQRADNEIGTNAKWLVAINLPTETGAAGSTGV